MEIRLLTARERFESAVISTIAFHGRMEDPEKAREMTMNDTTDDWGAFDDDGRLMAHVVNNRFESRLNGQWVVNGGIGGVSTLPEYRNTGAVRAIFGKLLPDAYKNGEVISTLYPFKHAFYRKFGYETVCHANCYGFAPDALREYRFGGTIRHWRPGDPIDDYLALYEAFSKDFNLAFRRDEARMTRAHFGGSFLKDRKFAYLLCEGDCPVAYVIFQDVRSEPAALLRVDDVAWRGRAGFEAVLGFLGRFSADYGKIELSLPANMELFSLIHAPDQYSISKRTIQNYMIRVVNAEKALGTLRPDASFTVRVTDDMIPENNGTWRVSAEGAARTDDEPDIRLDVRALGQLISGAVSLFEAEYRCDVQVYENRPALERAFVRKPIMVQDHF